MPATYEPIATTTLSSATATITFSSIPNTYTDLRLVVIGNIVNATQAQCGLQFNGDTASNYSATLMVGDGSTASSSRLTSQVRAYIGSFNNNTQPNMFTADIMSYTGSAFKTLVSAASMDLNGTGYVYRSVSLWRSTSAITSMTILSPSQTLQAGTTATLYGIKAA